MNMLKKICVLISVAINGVLLADNSFIDTQTNQINYNLAGCSCGCSCTSECGCGCAMNSKCRCNGPDDCVTIEDYYDGETECQRAAECGKCGVWLPEEPVLFKPLLADPRQITYSVGWRFNDQVLANNIADVSFGDTVAIYQWCNVWPYRGKLRIELEGALWAVFAQCQESAPLINADYYVGIPITYAIPHWQFRLRFFHISSHIGDEFLINNLPKGFRRKNPSAEYLDFFVSHDFTPDLRLYGGVGWMVQQDESFCIGPFYAEGGVELHLQGLRYVDHCDRLYGVPFYAMNFRYNKVFKNHVDATYVLGYEWGKFCGLCRKLRVFLEYHDGYSLEGQFQKFPTNYFSIRASYGF